MQDTNRNSEDQVGSDSPGRGNPEQPPAWAPPQANRNAFFDDQRTVFQRMTHEAQTSPEDDVDDVFSAPLEAADEHLTTQLDLSDGEIAKAPPPSNSSGEDQTTQLTPGDWVATADRQNVFGPAGLALSELHDEGLGATMHGSQAFASFPAQEDTPDMQETTMLPPRAQTDQLSGSVQAAINEPAPQAGGNFVNPEQDAATGYTYPGDQGMQAPTQGSDDALTTMLTPEYAQQQYPELLDQATQFAPQPNQQIDSGNPGDFATGFGPQQAMGGHPDPYAPQPADQQPYQSLPYDGQLQRDEQITYIQQQYPEHQHPDQPFYPDPQQNYQADATYPPNAAEQPTYPAGYLPQQTPYDPSHGANYQGTEMGYPPHVEPEPGYGSPEQSYPQAEPQYAAFEQQHPAPEQQYLQPPPVEQTPVDAIPLGERPMTELPMGPEPAQPPSPTVGNALVSVETQNSPYMVPQNIPGRFVPTAEEFAARRAHKPQTPEATMGLPGLVKRLTFGIFAPPMSKREEEHREYITTVRRNFGGLRQITVVNPKGGAGKTVASLMTAMTFGQNRGGYVLAWDNNETQGTLGMRAQPDFHAHTVRDVLQSLDTFLGPSGKVGDLSSFVRSQGEAMFDVLASDESATAGEMLTAAAFKQIREVVSRFYKLIIVDTGNNVRAENWQAAIDQTDQLVVTMSARGDSAETAARMLDHLEQTGRSSLVRHAVTVVSMPPSRRGLDLPAIERHFSARTRQVLIAPYEPIIDSGEPIRYESISNASKEAWLKIASNVAEGL